MQSSPLSCGNHYETADSLLSLQLDSIVVSILPALNEEYFSTAIDRFCMYMNAQSHLLTLCGYRRLEFSQVQITSEKDDLFILANLGCSACLQLHQVEPDVQSLQNDSRSFAMPHVTPITHLFCFWLSPSLFTKSLFLVDLEEIGADFPNCGGVTIEGAKETTTKHPGE
ncbi:hypothetical protein BLNAU_24927 [Blattamonas nauphoetae]|uniref:Uncharacterized protein n=1 Tax=Blattamonas nauphoetae TaxID=2049346 RepID=A0ABQ9WL27_9EUKA|nr:hypothetical protein BLNAU_24927 [Blattamonas nauphoetae]